MVSAVVAHAAEQQKPNILWIITDDQRPDALQCYNRATTGKSDSALGYVSSPNVDKLASEGVLFTNTFCNSPASSPSRGSMHTGRYPFHSGIYGGELTHHMNDFSEPVIPEVMEEYGYNTIAFGKTGFYIFDYNTPMNYIGEPRIYQQRVRMEEDLERVGVTDWCKNDLRDMIGTSHGTLESWYYPDGSVTEYYLKHDGGGGMTEEDIRIAEEFRKKQDMIIMPHGVFGMVIAGENTMPTQMTLDGRIKEEFCRFFDHENTSYEMLNGKRAVRGVDPSKPQFIHLGFHFPHTAVMPSKEYRDQFKNLDYNIPGLTQEEFDKMPAQIKKWANNFNVDTLTDEEKLKCIRDYYAFCAMGDQLIGEAVDRFKEYCADKDQPYVIVYACGDHGWHLGEQGVYAKFSSYRQSTHTAVIVSASDKSIFKDGEVVNDLVEYVDFAPTFFGIAGADTNEERFDYLDGRDLAITATGAEKPRDYIIGEGNTGGCVRAYMLGDEFSFSMRTRKMSSKVTAKNPANGDIKWALECPAEDAELALFDLRVDPEEKNNVAYDKKYADLAAWFRTKLGNIALGDNRIECDWNEINSYNISDFAVGSDDKLLDIPANIIPKVKPITK